MLLEKQEDDMDASMLVDGDFALPCFMAALEGAGIAPPSLNVPYAELMPSYTSDSAKQATLSKYGL